jgi:hypothetical protein
MSEIDKHGRLKEENFRYRVSKKDKKVFIFWHEKQVMILKGEASETFLAKLSVAEPEEAQLIMAKVTGNFKHGNEKISKGK